MNTSEQPAIGNLFDAIGREFGEKEKHFSRHLQQMSRFCEYCFDPSEILTV